MKIKLDNSPKDKNTFEQICIGFFIHDLYVLDNSADNVNNLYSYSFSLFDIKNKVKVNYIEKNNEIKIEGHEALNSLTISTSLESFVYSKFKYWLSEYNKSTSDNLICDLSANISLKFKML